MAVETVKARFGAEKRVGGGAGRPEWTEDEDEDGDGDGVGTGAKSGVSTTEILRASLLVACDGVRSAVQRERLRGTDQNLNYLGVVLVTGFTTLSHPLLDGQGFYTLDGERARIFTMPFKSDDDARGRGAGWERFSRESDETGMDHPAGQSDETGMDHHPSAAGKDAANEAGSRRAGSRRAPLTMWQISVRVTEEEARRIASAPRAGPGRERIRQSSSRLARPGSAMFDAAVWEDSWAGPLYDRDRPPPPPTGKDARSRVVAIGDAAHPMSPFKGMGANSALFDAWSLASWLEKAPIPRAIANFEREMIARAWAKVDASREAVDLFHGPAAVAGETPEFAGVAPELAKTFLKTLGEKGVGAGCGGSLEGRVREAMAELGVPVDESASANPRVPPSRASGGEGERNGAPGLGGCGAFVVVVRSRGRGRLVGGSDERRGRRGEGRAGGGGRRFRPRRLRGLSPPDGSSGLRKYSARGRPAHDWVSRAALKIVARAHGGGGGAGRRRRGGGTNRGSTESSEDGAGDSPPGDSPPGDDSTTTARLVGGAKGGARRNGSTPRTAASPPRSPRVARKIRDELRMVRHVIADARWTTTSNRDHHRRAARALRAKGLVACAGAGSITPCTAAG